MLMIERVARVFDAEVKRQEESWLRSVDLICLYDLGRSRFTIKIMHSSTTIFVCL